MAEIPRRPRVFDGATLRRLAAEFVVIVVGVLVAFAVDDWQEGRARQALAQRLLTTVEVDVRESVADLREAAWSARVRQSALVELMRRVGVPLPPEDEWVPWQDAPFDSLRGAALNVIPALDDFERMITLPVYVQVFDPRTVAYDELRATGALQSIESEEAHDRLVGLYSSMLDFAESNDFHRRDQYALQDAFQAAGVIAGDWLAEEEIVRRLRSSPEARAALRRQYMRTRDQWLSYPVVADRIQEEGAAVVALGRGG